MALGKASQACSEFDVKLIGPLTSLYLIQLRISPIRRAKIEDVPTTNLGLKYFPGASFSQICNTKKVRP